MRYLIILIGLLFTSISNAGTIDPKVSDNKYIEYGAEYECILRISGKDVAGRNFLASCVLIEPNIILTAAHIGSITKEAHVYNDEAKGKVLIFVSPKEYEEKAFGGNGCDISVGLLDNKIDIKYYPTLYENNDELNKVCGLSGFGMTGNFDTGVTKSDGKKRAGSNIIQKIEQNDLLVCSVQDIPSTSLEFLIAGGDSGGGLFIDKKLAGIHSSIYTYGNIPPKSDRKTLSIHTRISKHKDWIRETIRELKNANIGRTTGNDGQ